MELTIHVKQNLSLSPRQLQSMRILQMNCTELTEYIEACALENPMLEMEYQHGGTAAEAEFERLDIHNNSVNPLDADENDYFSTVFARLSAKDTLADHLFSQLRMAEADREITLLCAYLIAQLDELNAIKETREFELAQLDELIQAKAEELDALAASIGVDEEMLFLYWDEIVTMGADIEELERLEAERIAEEERKRKEEEGKKKSSDMSTVNVGIGHDNNFIVTKLVNIKILAYTCTESKNNRS